MMPALAPVQQRQRPAQAVGIGRHQDEVHVVRHQAPRPHGDAGGVTMLGEEVAIEGVVVVAKERTRAAVAALGDMVRVIRNDDAGKAGDARFWLAPGLASIKCTVTVIS
jgi:hypothetical protein